MFIRTERSIRDFFQFYPIVSLILIINLLLWVIINLLQLPIGEAIYYMAVGHNYSVHTYGEYWRLITPIFLHADFAHVAFNSFALVLFGPALERMIGKGPFSLVYIITGFVGNLGTYIVSPLSMTPHLGASGAIYGLFGIYMYMSFNRKDLMSSNDAQIIRVIFILGLVMTFIRPNINIPAHIFGFIAGFALGPVSLKKAIPFVRPISHPRRRTEGNIQFDPNRWNKNEPFVKFIKKNFIWIIIALLAIIGLLSSLF